MSFRGIPAVPPASPENQNFLGALKQNVEQLVAESNAASSATATAASTAIYATLTYDGVLLNAYTDGTLKPGEIDKATTTIQLWTAGAQITSSGITYSIVSTTGCTASVDVYGVVTLATVTADTATTVVQATYQGINYSKAFSVAKVLDTSGLVISLSNELCALEAYANGGVISFSAAHGQVSVTVNGTDIMSTVTLSATAAGCTGTVNTATGSPVSAQPKGYYEVTAVPGDTASLTINVTVSGTVYTKVFRLTKNSVGYEIVGTLPVANLFQGRVVFLTTDNKLYRYDGGAWTTAVPTVDLTGTISSAQIANGSISGTKFASGLEPVTVVSSVPSTATTNTIFNTSDGKLYRWNGSAYIKTTPGADIVANSITAGQIQAGAISTTELAANAVTAAKIAAGTITANEIAANTITAAKIAASTITATQIATGTITANEIAAGTITAAKIASNTITAAQIATGTITASNIVTNTITASQISLGGVTTTSLANNAATQPTYTLDTGTVALTSTPKVIHSVSVSLPDNNSSILINFSVTIDNPAGTDVCDIDCWLGGTDMKHSANYTPVGTSLVFSHPAFIVTPGSGSWIIYLYANVGGTVGISKVLSELYVTRVYR